MHLSRRSFFAAVMGAIAAPVVVPKLSEQAQALARFEAIWGELKQSCGDYVNYHYTVWDSLTITPGSVVNERLLPPPMPDDFVVTHITSHYNSDAPLDSLATVAKAVGLTLKQGGYDLIETASLIYFPTGDMPMQFMPALPFTKGDNDLGVYLCSDGPVPSVDPVTVSIVLQGFVRLSREQQRHGGLISQTA